MSIIALRVKGVDAQQLVHVLNSLQSAPPSLAAVTVVGKNVYVSNQDTSSAIAYPHGEVIYAITVLATDEARAKATAEAALAALP